MNKPTEVEKLLMDLIARESITGNETIIAGFIESKLSGFRMRRQYIDKERFNIIAKKGRSDVWIVAHMDTVPPVLPIKITTDKICGRGAVDNKGNIAGAIFAARTLENINMLFTVGEEVNFAGAEKIGVIKGKAIVLEPTEFKVRFAQCGVVSMRITASGEQKHSSLLVRDRESALHVLTNTLAVLMKKKWHCFNVGTMRGGVAENVVAGSAEAMVSVRPRNNAEFLDILKTVRALKGVKVEIINKLPPFVSTLAGDKKLPGSREPVSFFSELSFFENGILFGAGSIAQAHMPGEYILRKDLNRLSGELVKLAGKLQ
jgi:acetylornithine deacetylase/succinyl-diaminopimelate desuccinylase-like protein